MRPEKTENRLSAAARSESVETVRFLLAKGADVNGRDISGNTALQPALESNYKRQKLRDRKNAIGSRGRSQNRPL